MYLEKFSIVHNTYYNQPNISNVQVELESFNFSDIKNVLKQLIDKVIKFFKSVYNYIRSVVSKFKNSKHLKHLKDKFKEYKKSKLLNESNREVFKFINNKVNNISNESVNDLEIKYNEILKPSNADWLKCFLKSDLTFDTLLSICDNTLNGYNPVLSYLSGVKPEEITEDYNVFGIAAVRDYVGSYSTVVSNIKYESESNLDSNYIDNLLSRMDNIDQYLNKAEQLYFKYSKPLEKELDKLNKEFTRNYNTDDHWLTRLKITIYNDIIKIAYTPTYVAINYLKIMSELYNEVKHGDILTTTVKPNSKLYHLSINPDLDKLNPNSILNPIYPESGYKQLLPKRVCFAPTIENCIPGVYSLFDDNNTRLTKYTPSFLGLSNYNDDDYNAVILYLYEGIPNKDTKYIKSEVIKIAVPEALYSNEISVTTPIPVTKLGKYIFVYNRIKYRKNKNNLDLSIFEYINEYNGSHEPKMLVRS